MRWQRLFQDFEDQLDRETDAELEDLARDEERLRIARLSVVNRLRALAVAQNSRDGDRGSSTRVAMRVGRFDIECTIRRVGRDWMLVDITSPTFVAGSAIIPLCAVGFVRLLRQADVQCSLVPNRAGETPKLSDDISLTFVLRDLCRRRRTVTIVCGGGEVSGTLDRVGRDHVDIALHAIGESRATSANGEVIMVPLSRIELIHLP